MLLLHLESVSKLQLLLSLLQLLLFLQLSLTKLLQMLQSCCSDSCCFAAAVVTAITSHQAASFTTKLLYQQLMQLYLLLPQLLQLLLCCYCHCSLPLSCAWSRARAGGSQQGASIIHSGTSFVATHTTRLRMGESLGDRSTHGTSIVARSYTPEIPHSKHIIHCVLLRTIQ